jgi:hypothetical protein
MTQRKSLILAVGAFALLSAMDFVLTRYLLQDSGGAYEANPVANWLLQRHGWSGLAAFKIAIGALVAGVAAFVYGYRPRAASRLLIFGCAALTVVVAYSGALAVARQARGHLDPEVAREMQKEERLTNALEDVTEYRAVLEEVTTQLKAETMTLSDAVDQIVTTDKANDPDYLNTLHYIYPGLTDRGCLAASLVQNTLGTIDAALPGARRTSRRLLSALYTLCGTDSPTSFHPILRRLDGIETRRN